MKVDFKKNVASSFEETREFKFNNSPQLFKILSDNLYSDKIGSIVREISSNCLDAHKSVNKSHIPFEIYIPKDSVFDKSKSNIVFRDFGPGLSEEEMYNVYTTYCLSTKDSSNDFIGAFGIGSKSPFAYTQTFSVTSIKNGLKTLYCIFINDKGYPAISKISSINTDEKSGLIVSIPVNSKDIREFNNAIKKQLKRFDPLPIIKDQNGQDVSSAYFEAQSINYKKIIETDEYIFSLYERFAYVKPNIIIISGLEYEIPNILYDNIEIEIKKNHRFELKANIGDVDLSASRESLALTKKTIKYIDNSFRKIYSKILGDILKIENKWKYLIELRKYIEIDSSYSNYIKSLLKYANLENVERKFKLEDFNFNMLLFKRANEIQLVEHFRGHKKTAVKYCKPGAESTRKYIRNIKPTEKLKVISFSKLSRKNKDYIEESIFVYPTYKIKTEEDLARFKENIEMLSEFLTVDVIDGDVKYKSIEEAEKKERKKKISNYFRYLDIKDFRYLGVSDFLNVSSLENEVLIEDENVEDLFNDNTIVALYNSKNKRVSYFSGNPISIKLIESMVSYIKNNPKDKIFEKRIICLTESEIDKIKKRASVNIDEYTIDNFIKSVCEKLKSEHEEELRLFFSGDNYKNTSYVNVIKYLNSSDFKDIDNSNSNLLLSYFNYNKFYDSYYYILRLIQWEFPELFSEYKKSEELNSLIRKIDEEYPLLQIFNAALLYSNVSNVYLERLKMYLNCGGYNGK